MTLRRLFVLILTVPTAVFLLASGVAVSGTLREATDRVEQTGEAARNRILAVYTAELLDAGMDTDNIVRSLHNVDTDISALDLRTTGTDHPTGSSRLGALDDLKSPLAVTVEVPWPKEAPTARLTIFRPELGGNTYFPLWRLPAAGFALLAMSVALAIILAQFVEHLLTVFGSMIREMQRGNYRIRLTAPLLTRDADAVANHLNRLADSLDDRNRISRGYLAALRGKNEELERQITDREQAESALAGEKKRLQVTLASLAEGVIATDTDGLISLISRAACELTGWDEADAVGRPLMDVYNAEPLMTDVASPSRPGVPGRRTLSRRHAAHCIISESRAPIRDRDGEVSGSVVVFRDITAESRMEDELIRSQKHETTARLAGGIAHDFNNILTAIIGNIALARMDISERHEARQLLAEAEAAATRARDLTRQLLVLTRSDKPMRQRVDIREVIRSAARFTLHGSNVESSTTIPETLWTVEGDTDQLQQVIQNLVLNADQAMPNGGTVFMAARNLDVDSVTQYPVAPGSYIEIRIRDTGPGMSREELKRALDPFFTTRKRASGLGLPVAYSIVRNHGGHLELLSDPGKGTTAVILLPANPDAAPAVPAPAFTARPGPQLPTASEPPTNARVLLMDDEDAIRLMVRRGLTRYGFQVVTSPHGADAIQKFQAAFESGHAYDAIVLDLTIPGGIGGVECLRRIQEIAPDVVAIVASGYARDVQLSDFEKLGFRDYLRKPYRVEELRELLRHHLS